MADAVFFSRKKWFEAGFEGLAFNFKIHFFIFSKYKIYFIYLSRCNKNIYGLAEVNGSCSRRFLDANCYINVLVFLQLRGLRNIYLNFFQSGAIT